MSWADDMAAREAERARREAQRAKERKRRFWGTFFAVAAVMVVLIGIWLFAMVQQGQFFNLDRDPTVTDLLAVGAMAFVIPGLPLIWGITTWIDNKRD